MKKKLSSLMFLTTIASVVIFIINRITFYLATIDNLLNPYDGNYYEWKFGKIFYKKVGEGKPILLVHDLNSHSCGYEWKKAAQILSKTHKVYIIDLLGCGRSEKPNLTYTNFLYVQIITDFIKHIIGEETDIIATGESASFVMMACNTGNDLIGKIAMVNPLSLKELAKIPTKRTKTLKLLLQMPLIGALLYNILQSRKYINEIFHTKYYDDPLKIDEMLIKCYVEAAHLDYSHSKYLFASIKGRYTKGNLLPCMPNINHSIFIISGKGCDDSQEIQEQYQYYLPSIEAVSIPHTKFLPQLEDPEEFCEQIQIFFEDEN